MDELSPLPQPPTHWPHRQELSELRLSTPLPAVDLGTLRHSAERIVAAHAARRIVWRPNTPWAGVTAIAQTLSVAGAAGVSCGRLDSVPTSFAVLPVTLMLPPVVGDGPAQLAELCHRTEATVAVNQFAQAERLSAACVAADVAVNLLLRVDVGRGRLGVRPGPDLFDLAAGVSELAGVRLIGLAAESRRATGLARLTPDALVRLLDGCRNALTRAGHEISVVSVSRLDDVGAIETAGSVVTEARTPFPVEPNGPFAILAGVVGRPTRALAVIDAGEALLGRVATVVGPSDVRASVAMIDNDLAVLRLAEGGRDLAIGDVVAMMPEAGASPQPGLPVLVGEGEQWRRVNSL